MLIVAGAVMLLGGSVFALRPGRGRRMLRGIGREAGCMADERRRRSRVSLSFPLMVVYDGKQVRGVAQDLSLKGVSCATEGWLVPGRECVVILELDSGIRMKIHGRIIRSGQDSAIEFLRMDETSFSHLRNLVRLYADDADAVDEELRTPAFKVE